jgi:hypothetical protein
VLFNLFGRRTAALSLGGAAPLSPDLLQQVGQNFGLADMWAVSAGQLNRLHSEQLTSGPSLPCWRDRRSSEHTIYVDGTGGQARSSTVSPWLVSHKTPAVSKAPSPSAPADSRGTRTLARRYRPSVFADPRGVERRRIGAVLLDDAHAGAWHYRSKKHHATRGPALGNLWQVHSTGGVCDTDDIGLTRIRFTGTS